MRNTFLEDIDLQTTVMGVREELMKYFKGSCGQSVSQASNVQLCRLEVPRARYQYQRLERERQNPVSLHISGLHVMSLSKYPNTVTLIQENLTRSPQTRHLKTEIEDFLHKYLGGVTVKTKGNVATDEIDDGDRFEQQRVTRATYQTHYEPVPVSLGGRLSVEQMEEMISNFERNNNAPF